MRLCDEELNKAIAHEPQGTKRWRQLHDEAWRRMYDTVHPAFTEEALIFAKQRLRA